MTSLTEDIPRKIKRMRKRMTPRRGSPARKGASMRSGARPTTLSDPPGTPALGTRDRKAPGTHESPSFVTLLLGNILPHFTWMTLFNTLRKCSKPSLTRTHLEACRTTLMCSTGCSGSHGKAGKPRKGRLHKARRVAVPFPMQTAIQTARSKVHAGGPAASHPDAGPRLAGSPAWTPWRRRTCGTGPNLTSRKARQTLQTMVSAVCIFELVHHKCHNFMVYNVMPCNMHCLAKIWLHSLLIH